MAFDKESIFLSRLSFSYLADLKSMSLTLLHTFVTTMNI